MTGPDAQGRFDGAFIQRFRANGLRDSDPARYHNMVANPRVIVEKDGGRWRGLATPLSGDDYPIMWGRITEIRSSVDELHAGIQRQIPLVESSRT